MFDLVTIHPKYAGAAVMLYWSGLDLSYYIFMFSVKLWLAQLGAMFVFPNPCFLCDPELEYDLIELINPENRGMFEEMVWFSLDSLSSRRRWPLDGPHTELGVCVLVCCLTHHPGQKSFAGFSL